MKQDPTLNGSQKFCARQKVIRIGWPFLQDVRKRVADARARDTFVTSGIQNAKLQNELLGIITVWGGRKHRIFRIISAQQVMAGDCYFVNGESCFGILMI